MKRKKNGFAIALRVIAIIVVVVALINLLPTPQNFVGVNSLRVEKNQKPILIAHGGGNREFPDNTLEAFYNAYSVDKNFMLETDVSITKDGVVLLSHDINVDRKTNIVGDIADINYADLVKNEVDFNYENVKSSETGKIESLTVYKDYLGNNVSPLDVKYPDGVLPRHETKFLATTLEDLLIAFPNNKINVEIKQKGEIGLSALKAVVSLLEKYQAFDRVVLASFHAEIYKEIKKYQKDDYANMMFSPEYVGVIKFFVTRILQLDYFYREPIAVFQVPMEQYGIKLATKGFINDAHKHNIAVHYWTINAEKDMENLCLIGADGIMTDIPNRLKGVYDRLYNQDGTLKS